MDALAVIARLILAVVFAVSGVAKLFDRPGTRRAVEAFGLPTSAAGSVAAVLPLAELATAVALAPGTSARLAAMAAIVLLAAFTAGIASSLIAGRRPDCNCFGNLRSEPIGPGSLLRNGLFVVLAAIIAFAAGPDAGGSVAKAISRLDPLGVALAALATAAAILAAALVLRRNRREAAAPAITDDGVASPPVLEPGAAAPPFMLADTSGRRTSLDDLLARGKDVLLVFVSMNCNACLDLAPDLGRWQREFPGRLTIAIVSTGSASSVGSEAETYGFAELFVDGGAVSRQYGNRSTPAAALIHRNGTIASPPIAGVTEIAGLLLRAFGWDEVVAEIRDRHAHAHAKVSPQPPSSHEDQRETSNHEIDPDALGPSFVPQARDSVAMASRDGESVLVDSTSGLVHLLNPTAALVWQCLDGSGTLEEITSDIAEAFGRDANEVAASVLDVVRWFGREGLLVGVSVPAPSANIPS